MSIYLTGASGFVGKNLITNFNKDFDIKKHIRGSEFLIKQNTVIHLAGKAHDLKNISNKDEYYEVNTAKFIQEGSYKYIPYSKLFRRTW